MVGYHIQNTENLTSWVYDPEMSTIAWSFKKLPNCSRIVWISAAIAKSLSSRNGCGADDDIHPGRAGRSKPPHEAVQKALMIQTSHGCVLICLLKKCTHISHIVSLNTYLYVYKNAYVYLYIYITCIHIMYIHIHMFTYIRIICIYIYIFMYIHVYIYIYNVCFYVYIYIRDGKQHICQSYGKYLYLTPSSYVVIS